MPFDWLNPTVPSNVRARDPQRRVSAAKDEIRARAGLLLRLGYDQSYATHRCLGNQAWGYEMAGTPPLGREDVGQIVAEVFSGKSLKGA